VPKRDVHVSDASFAAGSNGWRTEMLRQRGHTRGDEAVTREFRHRDDVAGTGSRRGNQRVEKREMSYTEFGPKGECGRDVSGATFAHTSHLSPERWPRLVERGVELPGWVQRGNVVKAVNEWCTLHTYTIPSRAAPMPEGCSWTNLDLCGGWQRPWGIGEDEVILRRVLNSEKICGSFLALEDEKARTWQKLPNIESVRQQVQAHHDFELVEGGPHQTLENIVWCWVAPKCSLRDAVSLDEIAAWYEAVGWPRGAELIKAAGGLWLPDRAEDFDQHWEITGLVLGYPPASTAALLGIR